MTLLAPFLRFPVKTLPPGPLRFQAMTWDAQDDSAQGLVVTVHGVTPDGVSVCCNVLGFMPWFFVKLEDADEYDAVADAITRLNARRFEDSKLELSLELSKFADAYHPPGTVFPFIRVCCGTLDASRGLANMIRKGLFVGRERVAFTPHETKVDPSVRLCHARGISPTGWIEVRGATMSHTKTRAQLEVFCFDRGVFPAPVSRSRLTEASFDLEVYASEKGFPKPEVRDNVILHIGMTLQRPDADGVPQLVKTVFSLAPCDALDPAEHPDVVLVVRKTEKRLLEAWKQCIVMCDPDVIYSYNGDRFDWPYVIERCRMLGVCADFGRVPGRPVEMREPWEKPGEKKKMKRLADAKLPLDFLDGRVHVDMYFEIQGKVDTKKFTLKNVAALELDERKVEMPYQDIFAAWRNKDGALALKVALYCVMDTVLPQRLADKHQIIPSLMAMGNVALVSYKTLMYAGQTRKVASLILNQAAKQGYVFPDTTFGGDKYQGATVLDPVAGIYESPVVVLDFASLYPSIIRRHNLCFTTLVRPGTPMPENVYEIDVGHGATHAFAQGVESLLPTISTGLATERGSAKTEMKKHDKDSFEYKHLNLKQLALKLTGNSVYGALGTSIEGTPIAASVTGTGRNMINGTLVFMEREYAAHGAKVIYGDTDSVFINFPHATLAEAVALGQAASARANTELFLKPVELEYEKTFFPMVLFNAKKRYCAKKYEKATDAPRLARTGVASVRGDTWKLGNKMFDQAVEMVMAGAPREDVLEAVRDFLFAVRQGDGFSLDDFVLTNRLNDNYQNPEAVAAFQVVKKMKQRKEQEIPGVSDFVEFVIVRNGARLVAERAEYPAWVRRKKLPIDFGYYIENQFQNTMTTLLELWMSKSDIRILFETGARQQRLDQWFGQ